MARGGQDEARLEVEDLDGDGALDLLLLTRVGALRVLHNEGARFADLTVGSGLEQLVGAREVTTVDLDGDARRELLVRSSTGLVLFDAVDAFRFEATGSTLPLPESAQLAPLGVGSEVAPDEVEATGALGTDEAGRASSSAGAGSAPGVSLPASGSSSPRLAPPTISFAAKLPSQVCAESLNDQAGSGCLTASSVPVLGSLYPITSDLFVDAATGHVGLGTTTPANARLSIQTDGVSGISVSSGSAGPSTARFSSPNTSPLTPTVFATTGDGGTSGYFEERLAIGTLFLGLPSPKAELGIDAFDSSQLLLNNRFGTETVELLSAEVDGNGAQLELRTNDGQRTITMDAELGSRAAELAMFTRTGTETVEILSEEASGNGAQIVLRKANGIATMVLDAETDHAAEFSLRNSAGNETIEFLSEEVLGDGAQIVLRKNDGTPSIVLDAEQGVNGRITTDTLEITGGADLVESFHTRHAYAPGTVLCIDPERPGELTLSRTAYDVRVAGVVSGAGGVRPGLHLGQRGLLDGDTPVALTGRVYVRCSDEGGAIRPGDLLTTSSSAGVAMRAGDATLRAGAVLGKAMTALEGDSGLVLVLVSLQ